VFLPNPFDWDEVREDLFDFDNHVLWQENEEGRLRFALTFFFCIPRWSFSVYIPCCVVVQIMLKMHGPPELPDLNLNAEDEGEVGLDLNQIPGTTAINLFP
jgi:hypothetical protein